MKSLLALSLLCFGVALATPATPTLNAELRKELMRILQENPEAVDEERKEILEERGGEAATATIRLVGGSNSKEGRVQFVAANSSPGDWLQLCDDQFWDKDAATVACKQLGFIGLPKLLPSKGGFGSDEVLSYSPGFLCYGKETAIQKCDEGGTLTGNTFCRAPALLRCLTTSPKTRMTWLQSRVAEHAAAAEGEAKKETAEALEEHEKEDGEESLKEEIMRLLREKLREEGRKNAREELKEDERDLDLERGLSDEAVQAMHERFLQAVDEERRKILEERGGEAATAEEQEKAMEQEEAETAEEQKKEAGEQALEAEKAEKESLKEEIMRVLKEKLREAERDDELDEDNERAAWADLVKKEAEENRELAVENERDAFEEKWMNDY